MILDTHCHFDMMANPEKYIMDAEERGNIIIGMTNLPSHFQVGQKHIKIYKYIRLALGFHPQLVADNIKELDLFDSLVDNTSYIGEIGLDFSRDCKKYREVQIECLKHILSKLAGKKKIVSVHSRNAEKELLNILRDYNIKNVIFHWYTGPLGLIEDIVNEGYYFSINEAMTNTISGKKIINKIPNNRILTETDLPYNKQSNITNAILNCGLTEVLIQSNFNTLIKSIM